MPITEHISSPFTRAGWMWRRFRLMSPGEVVFRLGRSLRNRAWRSSPPVAGVPGAPAPVVWLVDLEKPEEVREYVRTRFQWDESAARDYFAHRFSFFRLDHADFGKEINWNHDYLNGINPPLGFGPAMDYRNAALCGDIKY